MAWPENFLRYVTGHSKQSCECSSPSPLLPVHVAHFLLEQIHFATSFLCWRILDAMRHPYVSAMEMRNRYQEESSSLLLLLRPPLTGSLSCEIRFYSRAPTLAGFFLLECVYIYIYIYVEFHPVRSIVLDVELGRFLQNFGTDFCCRTERFVCIHIPCNLISSFRMK